MNDMSGQGRIGLSPFSSPTAATLVVGALLGTAIVYLDIGIALVAPLMAGVLVLVLVVRLLHPPAEHQDSGNRIMRWTMAAFGAHLLFGLAVTNGGGFLFDILKAPDANAYHHNAVLIVQHWTDGFPMPRLPAGKEGFYFLLAGLYWAFGEHPVAGIVVNAVLSAALVPVVSDTTRRLFGADAMRYVAPILVLLPSLMLWPSQLLKEAPALLLFATGANCLVRLTDRVTLGSLTGLAASLALLFTIRGHVALALAAGMVAGAALGRRQVLSGVGVGAGALALIFLLLGIGLGNSGYDAAVNVDLQQANAVRRDLSVSGQSGFDADVDISTSQQALSYLPRGLFTFVLGPFPWQIRGIRQLPVVPDVLFWWFLLPSLWKGFTEGRRRIGRRVVGFALPALTTACLLALAIGNFGTLVRERMQVVVLVIPLISFGLSLRAAERRDAARQGESELAVGV